MRKYNTDSKRIRDLLNDLLTSNSNTSYRNTFYNIGKELGLILNDELKNNKNPLTLACASEDADWLAKGIIDNLSKPVDLCVYWSKRLNFGIDYNQNSLEFSKIEKSYEEIKINTDTLIITKSIISSSCVIKSQLIRLLSNYKFKQIYIVAPVIYKDAEKNLKEEFPDDVYNIFKFIYFALDEDLDKNNWVYPGIGGSVYDKLNIDPRSYYPELLLNRSTL